MRKTKAYIFGICFIVLQVFALSACGAQKADEEAYNEIETQGDDFASEKSSEELTITEEVEEHHELPVFDGITDFIILEGESIDLEKNVSALDYNGNELTFMVEAKELDTLTEGLYTVTYTATDEDGCQAVESCTVTVDPLSYTSTSGTEIKGTGRLDLYVNAAFDPLAGVCLSSDFAPDAEIVVDTTGLDMATEGSYTISYKAINLRGQTVKVYRTINLTLEPVYWGPEGGAVTWDVAGHKGQPYLVAVNRLMNTVTVYGKDDNNNYTIPVAAFVCSCGLPGMETITGTYITTSRYEWRPLIDGSFGRYAIRINGGFLFHSVPYNSMNKNDLKFNEFLLLGQPASHGCIRMSVHDVYWLYANCPTGFTTVIYDDPTLEGPLGKPVPAAIDITNEQTRGWDPTDPEFVME